MFDFGRPGSLYSLALVGLTILLLVVTYACMRAANRSSARRQEEDATVADEQVQQLLDKLTAQNRQAGDVHDTLAQGFTAIVVQLQAANDARSKGLDDDADEHVEIARRLARENLQEARNSARALRPGDHTA